MVDTDDGILECDQCGRMMKIPKDEMIASGFLKPEKKARLNTKALEDIDNLQVWSTRLSAAITSNEKRLTAFDDAIISLLATSARLEKKVAELTHDLEHERNQKIQWCGILGQFGARIYALENPVVEAKTKEKTTECLNDAKKSL